MLKKLCLGLACAVVLLGLVEAGFRILTAEPEDAPLWIPGPKGWQRSPIHVADPDLFWRTRPDVDIEYRGVRVRTNALGLRGPEVERKKAPLVRRILSLGESSTFGERVEQAETYSAVLERLLDERGGGSDYEVLNAGAPGYTIVQSAEYLRRRGLDLEPDVVLVYHGYNDFLPTAFLELRLSSVDVDTEELTDLALLERRHEPARRIAAWVASGSRAVRWTLARLAPEPAERAPVVETFATAEEPHPRVPAADRARVLAEIDRLLAERSVELVVLVPVYASFDGHRALLLEFGAQHPGRVLDLEEAVQRLGGDRRSWFADAAHPGPALHRAIAEVVRDFLVTRGVARGVTRDGPDGRRGGG